MTFLDRSLFRRPSVLIGWPATQSAPPVFPKPIAGRGFDGPHDGFTREGRNTRFIASLNGDKPGNASSAASALARHGAAIRATAVADRQAAVHAELRRVAQAREVRK